MFSKPQAEHHWLDQLIGQWTFQGQCSMGPDAPPMKSSGTETVRTLGGLWILAESQTATPDGETATNLMTLGYDPAEQVYVGSFICSVTHHMWSYRGTLDAGGKRLTLDTVGPDFHKPGAMVPYQDILELVADNHRILRSQVQTPDGGWTPIVEMHYHRV